MSRRRREKKLKIFTVREADIAYFSKSCSAKRVGLQPPQPPLPWIRHCGGMGAAQAPIGVQGQGHAPQKIRGFY